MYIRPHLLSALAMIIMLMGAYPDHGLAGSKVGDKLRVAILDFESASTDAAMNSLGKGLQSMLTTDLSQVGALQLVERQRLQDIQAELKLGQSSAFDKKTAAKVGKLAGATHLLTGTYTVVGDSMRIDARLFAVEKGEILLATQVEGETDAFFELEKDLARKIIRAFGVKMAPKERAAISRIHTADFQAFRNPV